LEVRVTDCELARMLGLDEKAVRRPRDPLHRSPSAGSRRRFMWS
jgi:hypothetical protein